MPDIFHQAGAIPFRMVHGAPDVLLISTSSGKNLTIPKGLIDPGFSVVETVHNEAMEEAGLRGELLSPAVGTYSFNKWGGVCRVQVFVMRVEELLDDWPEAGWRRRIWMGFSEAASRVKHADLGRLILKVPRLIGC